MGRRGRIFSSETEPNLDFLRKKKDSSWSKTMRGIWESGKFYFFFRSRVPEQPFAPSLAVCQELLCAAFVPTGWKVMETLVMRRQRAFGEEETAWCFDWMLQKPFVSIFAPACTWAAMSKQATFWFVPAVFHCFRVCPLWGNKMRVIRSADQGEN